MTSLTVNSDCITELTAVELKTYLSFLQECQSGNQRPNAQQVAKNINRSLRRVKEDMTHVEDKGWAKVIQNFRADGGAHFNIYYLKGCHY